MPVEIWPIRDFNRKVEEHAGKEFDIDQEVEKQDYLRAVRELGQRAILRGDGLAVYVNHDLGHPDVGQWQIVSYGSEASQLETREVNTLTEENRVAYVRGTYVYGDDLIPTTLPDIGGRINWRYQLHAIVPSGEQVAVVLAKGAATRVGTSHDRLVVVQVKVSGGATKEEALVIVTRAVEAGLGNWEDSGGEIGFDADEPLGIDAYSKGVRLLVVDSAVI